MSFEPGVALQTVDIAIEACQEVQGEPQIDDGRGWAFRTSRFFAGRRLLPTRRRGTRVGAAGPSPGCRHAVFLLCNGSYLPPSPLQYTPSLYHILIITTSTAYP